MIPREDQIQRKDSAKALLDHPLVKEFFKSAEEQLFKQWQNLSMGSESEREILFLQQQGLKAFEGFFNKLIIDGQLAESDLKRSGKL